MQFHRPQFGGGEQPYFIQLGLDGST
jgi:hypothetical protein